MLYRGMDRAQLDAAYDNLASNSIRETPCRLGCAQRALS